MTSPTIARTAVCLCKHPTVWHSGENACVIPGCDCGRVYRLSSFEQLPTAEAQEARLTAVGYPPRQQGEDEALKALGGRR